jgi:pilus assembly protein CpaB
MPQQRSLVVLGLAVLLGLAAVFVANSYFAGVQQEQQQVTVESVKVAVARVALEFGAEITADKVSFVDFPVNAVPAGSFDSIQRLLPMNTRRAALRPIAANEIILSSKISGEGGRATISAVLRPNMRAAAVRVSDVSGVAGFVLPGDTVDVLITRSFADAQGGPAVQITDILLQNIRVLAIDQNASESSKEPVVSKTATLEVTQIDAQKLALAQTVGTVSLTLRNISDRVNPVVETVGTEDLRDGAYSGGAHGVGPPFIPSMPLRPAGGAPKRKTDEVTVRIVRGTAISSYSVRRRDF